MVLIKTYVQYTVFNAHSSDFVNESSYENYPIMLIPPIIIGILSRAST
jgi:hypothetical protein